jgi:hypothetical protein
MNYYPAEVPLCVCVRVGVCEGITIPSTKPQISAQVLKLFPLLHSPSIPITLSSSFPNPPNLLSAYFCQKDERAHRGQLSGQ